MPKGRRRVFMRKKGILLILSVFIATLLVGCGEKSKYETDLENGVRKYDNGEEMTKDEYEAVKDMKDWSAKQKEENSKKTYSDWNN